MQIICTVGHKTYICTKVFLEYWKSGLFVNFGKFPAPGSGSRSAKSKRIRIKNTTLNKLLHSSAETGPGFANSDPDPAFERSVWVTLNPERSSQIRGLKELQILQYIFMTINYVSIQIRISSRIFLFKIAPNKGKRSYNFKSLNFLRELGSRA